MNIKQYERVAKIVQIEVPEDIPVRVMRSSFFPDELGDYEGYCIEDNRLTGERYLQKRRIENGAVVYANIGEIV